MEKALGSSCNEKQYVLISKKFAVYKINCCRISRDLTAGTYKMETVELVLEGCGVKVVSNLPEINQISIYDNNYWSLA